MEDKKPSKSEAKVSKLLELRNELNLERDVLALKYEIKQLNYALESLEYGNISTENEDGKPV